MSDAAILLKGMAKRYGTREVLTAVDLRVDRGAFHALLGPNGAGKTTLLRCLMGLIRPDGGEGYVLGARLGLSYPQLSLKARIGYVAQQPALYDRMTAGELIAMCRELNARWNDGIVKRYMDLFSLPARRTVRQMSSGMRSLLALTLVMGGDPELLILDEPTLGLDPVNRLQYMKALLEDSMEAERTVLLSSHDLYQIERMADRVTILHQGRVLLNESVDDMKLVEKRVRVGGNPDQAALAAVPGVRRVLREQSGWLLAARGETRELHDTLSRVAGVTGVQVLDQSLEEIFLSYVS